MARIDVNDRVPRMLLQKAYILILTVPIALRAQQVTLKEVKLESLVILVPVLVLKHMPFFYDNIGLEAQTQL